MITDFITNYPDPLPRYMICERKTIPKLPNVLNVLNLVYIDLDRCGLESIDGIARHKNLRELYIQRNRITTIPDEIIQLRNLRNLSVKYNFIEKLPKNFNKLKLQYFTIDWNELTDIDIIKDMKSLKQVFAGHNNIVRFPDINNLPHLSHFSLEYNRVEEIPVIHCKNLISLDVSNNFIKYINSMYVPKLNFIQLHGNPIVKIDGSFNPENLEYLSIDGEGEGEEGENTVYNMFEDDSSASIIGKLILLGYIITDLA